MSNSSNSTTMVPKPKAILGSLDLEWLEAETIATLQRHGNNSSVKIVHDPGKGRDRLLLQSNNLGKKAKTWLLEQHGAMLAKRVFPSKGVANFFI